MADYIEADLDQMVFEDREQGYGAYDLRTRYPRHLAIGTAIATVLALLVAFGPLITELLFPSDKEAGVTTKAVTINMEDLPPPPPVDDETPPPPPPPPDLPPPQIKTVAFQIPEPTPEEELEEEQTIADIEELKDAPNIGLEDKEGADEGFFTGEIDSDGDVPEVIVNTEPDPNEFIFAEEEPRPVNMDDVRKLIGYPQMARDAGIEGVAVFRVLVDKRGNYKKHRIVQQGHSMLSSAVSEHISRLKFTPAIQGGKPIEFWVNIPFNFKLIE